MKTPYEKILAAYYAKGGEVTMCPTMPMEASLRMRPKYGRGSISWAGRSKVTNGNLSGKRG